MTNSPEPETGQKRLEITIERGGDKTIVIEKEPRERVQLERFWPTGPRGTPSPRRGSEKGRKKRPLGRGKTRPNSKVRNSYPKCPLPFLLQAESPAPPWGQAIGILGKATGLLVN
jgi:hypothetical protein